ncbi:MAG: hypothetical protein OXU72_10875 [Gammaproteobacteria bacterium]|nr:hypothetical protein [Gammaproteobacteria bacterium]
MITRRTLLGTAVAAAVVSPFARGNEALQAAMAESQLIYLTPLQSSGAESRCQAEIWYALHEGAMYVVTATDAWRTEAVRRGLTRARVWVGDVGNWRRADGRYRNLPVVEATASVEMDAARHEQVLTAMGEKYADEWPTWGPRFRNSLADGSRVMLKYQPDAA